MNKVVKWMLVIAGALAALVVFVLIVLAMVIDVEQYKPQIEQRIADATGRSFRLGGDLKPSFFPWIGVRLSDLHLGNPPGFSGEDFVAVEVFDVRVKLLPLLTRHIEVKRFVMNRPTIVLERREDGSGNWEGLGAATSKPATTDQQPPAATDGELPIKGLTVHEFDITDGRIVWIDRSTETRQEVEQINLTLTDLSLDKPVGVAFGAVVEGKPVGLSGRIGPVGPRPGKAPVAVDLDLELLGQVEVNLAGDVDPSANPVKLDLTVDVAEFSPRRVMDRLGGTLPVAPADPDVLSAVDLSFGLEGSAEAIQVSDGTFRLDDSRGTFSARVMAFANPDLKLEVALDAIDLDRYLPADTDAPPPAKPASPPADAAAKATDYGPLRRLILDARAAVGEFKVKKARMRNVELRVAARDGVIRLDPMKLELYQGTLNGTGTVNVQGDQPATDVRMRLADVQAGPLVRDVMAKDLIEGTLVADVDLRFTGDAPPEIRRTIDGKGDLRFTNGAVVGIDLAAMVRNVGAAFGLAENPAVRPRTDFAELLLPFTITDGLLRTDAARLNSPLLRVLATGRADLAEETLAFRVEPKFVATLKGQGDTVQRSGVQVPVMIGGSFSAPTFTPDLAAILNQPLPDKEALKQMIPPEEDRRKMIEEGVKGLFKKWGNQ